MTCRDFETNVLALARGGLMDAGLRARASAHAEACARCAKRLAAERALSSCVRAVVEELAGEGMPAGAKAALLAAFRQQQGAAASPAAAPRLTGAGLRSRRRLAAAAVIILTLISAAAVFRLRAGGPPPSRQAAVASLPALPPEPPGPAIQSGPAAGPPQHKARPRRRAHRRAPARAASHDEQVTEYFPLSDGAELDAEAVHVVRVELPASALNDLGMRAEALTADGPVKADVLLGHDGLARAIRFVR